MTRPGDRATALAAFARTVARALALVAAAAACSPSPPKAEFRAVVLPRTEGATVTEDDVRSRAIDVSLTLGEMGIERREVLPLPGGRIRIVLPESVAPRLAEVRERLADPKLGIRVE